MSKFKCINGWTKAKMIEHIKKEFKGKSVYYQDDKWPVCSYHGTEGKKCAIGMFIPNEHYTNYMEGNSVLSLLQDFPYVIDLMPMDKVACNDFQGIHDKCALDHVSDDDTLKKLIHFVETRVEDE